MPGLILVIEDEPGIVDFLRRGLRAHGFEVLAALDGISGTDLALNEDVDLIVLDMMLPGRSGLEVLASVSAAKPGLPVIVLTARGDIDRRTRCRCRRLPGQAVLARGARRAGPCSIACGDANAGDRDPRRRHRG